MLSSWHLEMMSSLKQKLMVWKKSTLMQKLDVQIESFQISSNQKKFCQFNKISSQLRNNFEFEKLRKRKKLFEKESDFSEKNSKHSFDKILKEIHGCNSNKKISTLIQNISWCLRSELLRK